MSTILYIDGKNIKHYLKRSLKDAGIQENKLNLKNFDCTTLFNQVLKGIPIFQKNNLKKSGIKVIIGGNVRPQEITLNGKIKLFRF